MFQSAQGSKIKNAERKIFSTGSDGKLWKIRFHLCQIKAELSVPKFDSLVYSFMLFNYYFKLFRPNFFGQFPLPCKDDFNYKIIKKNRTSQVEHQTVKIAFSMI